MATVTAVTGVFNTTNNGAVASGSFTPTAGDLLVVLTGHTGLAANPALSASANGITFTAVTNALKNTSADICTLWVANQLVPASPAAMTITTTPGSSSGGGLFPFRVSGVPRAGTPAVKKTAVQANQAAAGTPTPNFGSATAAGNPLLAMLFNAGTAGSVGTPPTGWSEAGDLGYTVPAAGAEACFLAAGSTSSSYAFGATSATAFCVVAAEIDASFTPDSIRQPSGAGNPRGAAAHQAAIMRARVF